MEINTNANYVIVPAKILLPALKTLAQYNSQQALVAVIIENMGQVSGNDFSINDRSKPSSEQRENEQVDGEQRASEQEGSEQAGGEQESFMGECDRMGYGEGGINE